MGREHDEGVNGRRLVYQPVWSRIGAAGYGVFALWWVVEAVAKGRAESVAVVAPVLLAFGAVVYAVFWRPAVIVDDAAAELRNVVRSVRVPWGSLEGIETRFALTLLVGDREYRSWAAAAPGRPSLVARPGPDDAAAGTPVSTASGSGPRSSRSLRADSGAAAFMVEQRWVERREEASGGDVQVSWARAWPAVTALATVAALAAALLI
jgi:hypothetical protein